MCSSILPCRSSWVSIPLSPLSSKVRIFRKRENFLYSSQRHTNAPSPLSFLAFPCVYSWWKCSEGCVLATGLSELSTICAECTAAASLTCKGGCLQISQVLFPSWSCPIQVQIQGLWESSRGLISGLIWTWMWPCQGGAAAAMPHCTGSAHSTHSLPKCFCTGAGEP